MKVIFLKFNELNKKKIIRVKKKKTKDHSSEREMLDEKPDERTSQSLFSYRLHRRSSGKCHWVGYDGRYQWIEVEMEGKLLFGNFSAWWSRGSQHFSFFFSFFLFLLLLFTILITLFVHWFWFFLLFYDCMHSMRRCWVYERPHFQWLEVAQMQRLT